MAQAWLDASRDLGIRVEHPFRFLSSQGEAIVTQGVYLPGFGSEQGALLTCRFDSDDVYQAIEESSYFQSSLSPSYYEPYDRSTFVDTLNDWGWFGDVDAVPEWFSGGLGKHGGNQ